MAANLESVAEGAAWGVVELLSVRWGGSGSGNAVRGMDGALGVDDQSPMQGTRAEVEVASSCNNATVQAVSKSLGRKTSTIALIHGIKHGIGGLRVGF